MPNNPAMTIANDQTLIDLIKSASRRLVYLAPGVSKPVATAIADRYADLPQEWITVILDVDPEVCRLGYGDITGLELLEQVSAQRGGMVQRQPGIRIGLVVADNQTLIYAPTPQLIEAAPGTEQPKPNAIRIGLPPADLERDLGLGPDGITQRSIGMDKATRSDITRAKDELKANPPQRFDISRTVRVFNAQFEFVELSLTGAAFDHRRLNIPTDLLGIEDNPNAPLTTSLQMAMKLDGIESLDPVTRLHEFKAWIIRKYLKHLAHYGYIVLRKDKDLLMLMVARLTKLAAQREAEMRANLTAALEQKRAALMRLLLPGVLKRPPNRWLRLFNSQPERLLDAELKNIFKKAERAIKPIEVRLVFKAVTYESLTDPVFTEQVRRVVPDLRELHEEYTAAKSAAPPRQTQPEHTKGGT